MAEETGAVRKQDVGGAVMFMMLALVSFTLVAIAGRAAAKGVTTVELMLIRSVLGAIIIVVIATATGARLADFKSERLGLHAGRSLVHFGAQFSWLYALTLIPLAELFALEFTAPLWVALLAPIVLRERLTIWRGLAALLGFVGAMIVVQPGLLAGTVGFRFSEGSLYAIASAVGFAISMVATKFLTRTETVLRILFYMHAFQAVIAAILLRGRIPMPDAVTMMWVVAVTLAGLTAHYGLAKAFSKADAIIVAPLDFFRLPLIALVGAVLYGEGLAPTLLVGAAFVVIGNLVNLYGERRTATRSKV